MEVVTYSQSKLYPIPSPHLQPTAAAANRYRMAAFLQRYVLENEFLRQSKAKVEASASDLLERLRETEEKLVKAQTATPTPSEAPRLIRTNARKATWTFGMHERSAAGGEGGASGRQWQGRGEGEGQSPTAQTSGGAGAPSKDEKGRGATQAELAVRRLEGRVCARCLCCGSSCKAGGGGGRGGSSSVSLQGAAIGRGGGGGGGGGGSRAERMAAASAQGELRLTRGLVAELSFLLSATEEERDSLASLLVLAERRMDSLVVAQEELALKLAWENLSAMEEEERQQQQQQQQQQHSELQYDSKRIVAETQDDMSGATEQQEQQEQHRGSSVHLALEQGKADDSIAKANSKAALEALELRRRVRELEILQEATESAAREIERENRRLKRCCGDSPPPWMSWAGEGGVVCSTAGREQSLPFRDSIASGISRATSEPTEPDEVRRSGESEGGSRCGRGRGNSLEERGMRQASDGRQQQDLSSPRSGDCSLSLPMLSAAEIGDGGGGGQSASAPMGIPGASRESSFSEVAQPQGWGWGGSAGASVRPEGRCRPRSSPFAQRPVGGEHGRAWGDQGRQRRGQRRRRGSLTGENDELDADDDGDSGDDGSLLVKGKLAWVLGLPAETTSENELLAEVMHLVVERGKANTDATVLEAQLLKMDEQSLHLSRLVAANRSTAISQSGGSRGGGSAEDRHSAPPASGPRASGRQGTGRGVDARSLVGMGVGYSGDATFLSSFCHDRSGDATAARRESRRGNGEAGVRTRQNSSDPAASASQSGGGNETTQQATAAPTRPTKSIVSRGGRLTMLQPRGKPRTTRPAESGEQNGTDKPAAVTGPELTTSAKPADSAMAKTAAEDAGKGSSKPLDDNTVRTSFSKTLHGRVVSIDVFCTKVRIVGWTMWQLNSPPSKMVFE